MVKINHDDEICQISAEIKIWNKRRNLKFVGKIKIIRSLLMSKLNNLFAYIPNLSPELSLKPNGMIF